MEIIKNGHTYKYNDINGKPYDEYKRDYMREYYKWKREGKQIDDSIKHQFVRSEENLKMIKDMLDKKMKKVDIISKLGITAPTFYDILKTNKEYFGDIVRTRKPKENK